MALDGDHQEFVSIAREYDAWITVELELRLTALRKYESGEELLTMAGVTTFRDTLLISGHLEFLLHQAIAAVGTAVPAMSGVTLPKMKKLQFEIEAICRCMNDIYKASTAGF